MSLNEATPEMWDKLYKTYKTLAVEETLNDSNKAGDKVNECGRRRTKYNASAEEELRDSVTGVFTDPVENPVHYNTGSVECIDAIRASMSDHEFDGYLKGNAMKYLWRYNYKGKPVEDLKKAMWYLERLTKEVEDARANTRW